MLKLPADCSMGLTEATSKTADAGDGAGSWQRLLCACENRRGEEEDGERELHFKHSPDNFD